MLSSKRKAPPMPMISYEKLSLQASRQSGGSFDLNSIQSHYNMLRNLEKKQFELLKESRENTLKQLKPIPMYFKL